MLVSILTFVMVRTAGGDPASLKLGLHASPESLARLRREMGLTDPWPVQYGHWLAHAVRGVPGRSYLAGPRVTHEVLNRFRAALELALPFIALAVPLGLAVRPGPPLRPRSPAARAKGLRFLRLVWRHAFPNALIPVVTVIALETGYLLGGAVITETVFARPGIGNLTVQALAARDYMLVQGTVLLFAVVFAVLNIIADVTNALLDPRIRY